MILNVLFLVLVFLYGAKSTPLKVNEEHLANNLGCLKCHQIDPNKINVHLVPHSHDDVGWLKTVDQYFFGMKTQIQQAAVQYIITSVVEALLEDSDRRYIQVETAFFWKWWKAQDDDMRQKFKFLVDSGQIEMVNGAWSMNDEACANYQSTIDQFTWGLRIINETVGTCGLPRVGWQIDPFGHSREQTSIFAQLGFDGVFFARLDHDDKSKREEDGTLDYAWQGSANLDNSIIFGGIFPTSLYFPPNGYCWDYGCHDDPIDDDPESPDYNIETVVNNFVNLTKEYAKYYPSKNIFIPMGGDFHYEAAEMNYLNMDRFIKAFHDHEELNVIYSTPSCYIQAVNNAQPQLQLKTDDFFPYSNDIHSFWTGYFSSRPNSKRFERVGHNVLQAAKQLISLNQPTGDKNVEYVESIRYLREIMGIMQHHDAITGTEKQHVADDYVRLLTRGIESAEKPLGEIVRDLLKIDQEDEVDIKLELSSCLLSNISICDVSQTSDSFVVAVYNPLAWPVTHYVRLPVNSENFIVQGPHGQEEYDIVDPISEFSFVNVSDHVTPSNHELIFKAHEIPPLGINMYYINKTNSKSNSVAESLPVPPVPPVLPVPFPPGDDYLVFGDDETGFAIDINTNLLKSITLNGVSINITQNFYYYYSETGDSDGTKIASGAYLFRPNSSTAEPLQGEVTNAGMVRGTHVHEFHQKWTDEKVDVTQIIRVYKDENYIEFDWLVGGIDVAVDNVGKEVISRFSVTSDFTNNNVFYTDSNGREMIKRTLNYRPDYSYNSSIEPVASNYYPVTSKIVIKDENKNLEIAVLTDRSQGGSSLADGQIELMVHRRMIRDDNKGVGESLNETEFGTGIYVRGSHYLVAGPVTVANSGNKTTATEERILAHKKLTQPWVGVGRATPDSVTFDEIKEKLKLSYAPLSKALPETVNILTLEPWKDDTYLLRFEHILEKNEDPALSTFEQKIDLEDLFDKLTIDEITETTLGANQLLEDYQKQSKYNWNIVGDKMHVFPAQKDTSETSITLTPMQIRTFIVKLKSKTGSGIAVKPFALMMALTILVYFLV